MPGEGNRKSRPGEDHTGIPVKQEPIMTTSEETAVVNVRVDLEGVARHWGTLLTLGILTALAGVVAIILPRAATLAVELLLGCLLVVDGVLQGVHAAQLRGRRGFGWKLAASLVSLAAGVLLLAFPLTGVLTLTLVVALFFLVSGVFKGILSLRWWPVGGAGWLLVSGIVSLLLGFGILVAFPEAAAWVVGLLVGIALLIDGSWLMGMAVAARRLRTAAESGEEAGLTRPFSREGARAHEEA
jgi:uncharacterized membrane protein HdeD (DUF308 family)